MKMTTLGIDLAKMVFHLVGLDEKGHEIMKKKVSRKDLAATIQNIPLAGSPWKPAGRPASGGGSSRRWNTRSS